MICLKLSRKVGIVCLAILAVTIPLAVLGNTDGSNSDDQTAEETPLHRFGRWMCGFGFRDSEAVDEMVEKLDLTEEETARVKELIEEANAIREELKGKMEEIRGIIGPKVKTLRSDLEIQGMQVVRKRMRWRRPDGSHELRHDQCPGCWTDEGSSGDGSS